MILPFFNSFRNWYRVPVTLALFLFNLAVFLAVTPRYNRTQTKIESLLSDHRFLRIQGQVFDQMILHHRTGFPPLSRKLTSAHSDSDSQEFMGRLALRSVYFARHALHFSFRGDQLAYHYWRRRFVEFQNLCQLDPSYHLGFSFFHHGWRSMITYQFVHAGFAHIFVNMLVLFIIGSYVEPLAGSALMLVIYLLSGMGAAIAFGLANGFTPVPLVGASGAIMGLLGMLMILTWGKKLRFVWMLPTRDFVGFVWLPSLLFVFYLVLGDIAGIIQTNPFFGSGIAHAAHVGGFLCGSVLTLLLLPLCPQNQNQFMIKREMGLVPLHLALEMPELSSQPRQSKSKLKTSA